MLSIAYTPLQLPAKHSNLVWNFENSCLFLKAKPCVPDKVKAPVEIKRGFPRMKSKNYRIWPVVSEELDPASAL